MCALAQLCPTLCDSMDCSPPGSSVHGILQARILEWMAMPSSGDHPRIKPKSPASPALAGRLFSTSATWKALLKIFTEKYKDIAENSCIPYNPVSPIINTLHWYSTFVRTNEPILIYYYYLKSIFHSNIRGLMRYLFFCTRILFRIHIAASCLVCSGSSWLW